MPSKAIVAFNDYDPEGSVVKAQGLTLTAANFDAQVAAWSAFMAGVMGITLGARIRSTIGNETKHTSNPKEAASSPLAQRENKWLVRYHETTGGLPHYMEIPCADLTKLDPNNRGFADLEETDVATFVSAFEAFVKSDDGLGVEVDSIEFKGANL